MKVNPRWIKTYIEHGLGYESPEMNTGDDVFTDDITTDQINVTFNSAGGEFVESISILKAYSFVQKHQNFEKPATSTYELFDFLKYETEELLKTTIARRLIESYELRDLTDITFEIEPSSNNSELDAQFGYDWKIFESQGWEKKEIQSGTMLFDFREVMFLINAELFRLPL